MKIKEIIIAVTIVLLIAATGCYQIPVYLPPFGLDKDTTATDTSWYKANSKNYSLSTVGDIRGLAALVDAGEDFAGRIMERKAAVAARRAGHRRKSG